MKQMRQLLLAVAVVSVAGPVLAGDEQDCFQGQQPQQRIEGCSALISRAPNDATVYHNRAVAFGLAGDIDSAIADYSKAIEIEPSTASAYDNRGRAYAMKGEHDRAAQDQAKADELLAKAIGQPNIPAAKASDAASSPKTAKPQPRAKAKASKPAAKEEPASGLGWLFTPWGSNANQAGPKNAKP
jgi:tetratricopeptide (TPR) repeat protein